MIKLFIDDVDLYREAGIVLEEFDIGVPEMKINKVSVPGRNGDLDMSKALTGYTHFHNRTIVLQLGIIGKEYTREAIRTLFFQSLYNKQIKVAFSHLEGYFLGHATINSHERTAAKSTIKVTIDCYPLRYIGEEIISRTILTTSPKTVSVHNMHMPVPVTIETTAQANVEYKGKRYSVQRGQHKLGIILEQGNNMFTVSGSGTLTIKFRMEVL